MKPSHCAFLATAILGAALAERAAAEPELQRGKREVRFERPEIDTAITEAETAADATTKAVNDELAEAGRDGKKREKLITAEMNDLVNALARLRKSFDDEGAWADQRAEVRIAFSKWRTLDPVLRHHWASKARDEFEDLHRDLRELARIYEIDAPAR